MKTTVIHHGVVVKPTLPALYRGVYTDLDDAGKELVILFTAPCHGTVVHAVHDDYAVGEHRRDWLPCMDTEEHPTTFWRRVPVGTAVTITQE